MKTWLTSVIVRIMYYEKQFRDRVILYIENGHSKAEASRHFSVSLNSIDRWLRLKKETGDSGKKPPSRPSRKLHNEAIMSYIKDHPDAYLREIAEHFNCAISGVFYALKRLKVTYKKNEIIQRAGRTKAQRLHQDRKENFKK